MKLREIIKLSSLVLNLDDISSGTKIYDETFDITDEQDTIKNGTIEERTINLLIRCFNLIYCEIATDYFSLISQEKITVTGGSYKLSGLENQFYKLIKLEDSAYREPQYKIYDNTLYIKDGEYSIAYSYIPPKCTLNSEVNNFNGKITDRIFVYGINKEYCFISGLYEEAESYRVKFEEGIKLVGRNQKNLTLYRRRWI